MKGHGVINALSAYEIYMTYLKLTGEDFLTVLSSYGIVSQWCKELMKVIDESGKSIYSYGNENSSLALMYCIPNVIEYEKIKQQILPKQIRTILHQSSIFNS